VFLIFIFLTVFMAIFIVAFEQVVKKEGYPSDFEEGAKWEYRNYFLWAIEWVPERIYKRRKEKVEEEDNPENQGMMGEDGETQADKEEKKG
jgi:hypothetical protein